MQWWVNGKPSGWVLGRGGDISARLYDKTLEIKTASRAHYNYILWADNGWTSPDAVYRLEVQFRRQALKELGINLVSQLVESHDKLWRYFTEDWLRLAVPAPDENRSRWPLDPLWQALSEAPLAAPKSGRLKRFRYERVPEDDRLLRPIAGFLTSFMAKRNIKDAKTGLREMGSDLKRYYDTVGNQDGQGFTGFVESRVLEKGKRYNSIDNRGEDVTHAARIAAAADAFLRAGKRQELAGDLHICERQRFAATYCNMESVVLQHKGVAPLPFILHLEEMLAQLQLRTRALSWIV
jgi:hypothetical protein